jgi:molybdate transport system ATP-binding protein
MRLEVDVQHRFGAFALEARFVTDGSLTALFGRSGAGKTSLVNIIGGLLHPDRGKVVVNGRVLVDTAKGVFVPRHRRRIGYVFQEPRLFPHLSVRQNLLYGYWFTPTAERRENLRRVIDLLGIGMLLDRGTAVLSGGEKQRVAIGRALLASPHLLLMDEPLASLDDARKSEILPYIERLRDEDRVPIVYVSHSVPEVTRLATTIVLLADGKVAAAGALAEVIGGVDFFPLTGHYGAGAVLEMQVTAHDEDYCLTTLRSVAGELLIPGIHAKIGAALRVLIRARDVVLALKPPKEISALNVLPGRVAEIGALDGPIVDVRVDLNGERLLARVTRLTLDRLALVPGRPVFAIIKTVSIDRRSLGQGRPMSDKIDVDEIAL